MVVHEDKEEVYVLVQYLNKNGSLMGAAWLWGIIISLSLTFLDYWMGITVGPNLQDHWENWDDVGAVLITVPNTC